MTTSFVCKVRFSQSWSYCVEHSCTYCLLRAVSGMDPRKQHKRSVILPGTCGHLASRFLQLNVWAVNCIDFTSALFSHQLSKVTITMYESSVANFFLRLGKRYLGSGVRSPDSLFVTNVQPLSSPESPILFRCHPAEIATIVPFRLSFYELLQKQFFKIAIKIV